MHEGVNGKPMTTSNQTKDRSKGALTSVYAVPLLSAADADRRSAWGRQEVCSPGVKGAAAGLDPWSLLARHHLGT